MSEKDKMKMTEEDFEITFAKAIYDQKNRQELAQYIAFDPSIEKKFYKWFCNKLKENNVEDYELHAHVKNMFNVLDSEIELQKCAKLLKLLY
jgi:hypothetical protein